MNDWVEKERPSMSHPESGRRVVRRGLRLTFLAAVLALGFVVSGAMQVSATSTRRFVLNDAASLAAGELEHTAVHSDGRVTLSADLERMALTEDVGLVYAVARAADGTVYLGTGNQGAIYRVTGEEITAFAQTQQLVVSSLALGGDGVLYAGTLPEGRIFAVDATGQTREIARPDEAEHIWALVWDETRARLFCATGPEGRVYAINPTDGVTTVWWDAPFAHVMSLARRPDGAMYAGTDGEALVARIDAPNQVAIVHDFPGNEITALAWRDETLAVVANEFADPPRIAASHAKQRSATAARAPRPRPGKGRLFRVHADARVERVFQQDQGHFTSVLIDGEGVFFAGSGHEGRIVRVQPDLRSATWIDVDERQVLDMAWSNDHLIFATGDAAAFYRVRDGRPSEAYWNSKVLDAQFRARWGRLTWQGEGALRFQTRSGNREEPDETWTEWSSVLRSSGPIRSPAGRFLQIRARMDQDADAQLTSVTAYFLPDNQRAFVRQVGLHAGTKAAQKQARAERQHHIPTPRSAYKLTWQVENPDADRLRYRLHYRAEGQSTWRSMLREDEALTALEYTWNTQAIPDGHYVIRVEASDELDNPAAYTLRSQADSEPIRVDNHAPRLERLRFASNRLRGRAVDGLGPIARLEYAVDGRDWRTFFPSDDLLDSAEEAFELDLSALQPGSYIVSVRATDASGNMGSDEIEIRRAP